MMMKECNCPKWTARCFDRPSGFVLVELMMVVAIISLMTAVAVISFSAMWGNQRFKRQAEDIVNVLQMAQNAASTSGRRYEIGFNTTYQGYVFREYTESEIYYDNDIFYNTIHGVYDDSLIKIGRFNESMTLYEVEFDYYTEDDIANMDESNDTFIFIVGRTGWITGGKIVVLDEDGLPWTIVVHRFATPVKLVKGEVDIYVPQDTENVRF